MLVVSNYFSCAGYYKDGTTGFLLSQGVVSYEIEPEDGIVDGVNVWIADNKAGMIKHFDGWKAKQIVPNSTTTSLNYDLDADGEDLWVMPGGRSGSWSNEYFRLDLQLFNKNDWSQVPSKEIDSIFDPIVVKIIEGENKVYVGSWGRGLLEMDRLGNLLERYTEDNSGLQDNPTVSGWVGISGIEIDEKDRIWMVNSNTNAPLVVKFPNGNWDSYSMGSLTSTSLPLGKLLIDNEDQKWIQMRNDGVIVYNNNGTIGNKDDDEYIKLTTQSGNGNLSSLSVLSFDIDQSGYVWVGTENGVSTFYNPSRIFSGQNFDATQVLVEQDGYVARLLENEQVTAVKIDPGNRKWFGTSSSGAFLMSEDGTEQVHHFTVENSPLLSNNILDIEVVEETGEVFFATGGGLISFKAGATTGGETFGHVYAYPNPVEPNYTGLIAIKGLVHSSNVKITDISGNVVFETTSEGGQAVWNGNSLGGYRVSTGVYLVFVTNDDGSQSMVTKILFVN